MPNEDEDDRYLILRPGDCLLIPARQNGHGVSVQAAMELEAMLNKPSDRVRTIWVEDPSAVRVLRMEREEEGEPFRVDVRKEGE